MTVWDHLRELKNRLLLSLLAFGVLFVICYIFAPSFVTVIMGINEDYIFVQSDVTELLAQYMKVALITALVLDSPIIAWQIYGFASPGLTKSESAKFLGILTGGLAFFAIGACFCYFIVIPFTLSFFYQLNTIGVEQLISVKNFISYIVALLFAFGCIFEMPVIAAILTSIGILKPKGMASARRIVIILCFVIGALITPPDIMSQCMVALPMMLLYEFSILVCKVIYAARRRKLIAQGIDPDEEQEEDDDEEDAPQGRWAAAKAQVDKKDKDKTKKKD